MEIRIYPEYIGKTNCFQAFCLSYFDEMRMCVEKHDANSQEHIHALLLGNKFNMSPMAFKRKLQSYKKTITNKKLRNNALHISNCENDRAFTHYMMLCKNGGEKLYYRVKHSYDFDSNIYCGKV